jgi:hypothetical protein
MIWTRTHPLAILLVLLLLTPAVSATVVLSSDSFTPNPPLIPGTQQHAVVQFSVIPSGSTTFARGHSLQMVTDLSGAKWSIQTTLDGRNAAQQSATGSAAFVNGEILSYSTNHDVGMVVTIDGLVPKTSSDQVMVLQIEEIDNSGNVVPGSIITISQPVAGSVVSAITLPAVPTLTPPLVTPAAPVTRSPGFAAGGALAALGASLILLSRRDP